MAAAPLVAMRVRRNTFESFSPLGAMEIEYGVDTDGCTATRPSTCSRRPAALNDEVAHSKPPPHGRLHPRVARVARQDARRGLRVLRRLVTSRLDHAAGVSSAPRR